MGLGKIFLFLKSLLKNVRQFYGVLWVLFDQ